MRIYLSSRYSRLEELQGYAQELRQRGHEVTSRWLQRSRQAPTSLDDPAWVATARKDLEDVAAADTVVSFTQPRGGDNGGGGRHAEFGMGLALGKRMIVVGLAENLFHTLPSVEVYPTWPQALEGLGVPHGNPAREGS